MIQERICKFCGAEVGSMDDDMWEVFSKRRCDKCRDAYPHQEKTT